MKNVVMIIAPKDFRDEELTEPKKIFEQAGVAVKVASSTLGRVTGMNGETVTPDLPIAKINVMNFDAIVFVGGTGAQVYFNSKAIHELVRTAYDNKKVIGAICIAPTILANAGVLNGKKATCYPSEASSLRNRGAYYTGSEIEIADKIVTANGPSAARDFARIILALMGK
jgi:protease I